MPAFSGDVGDTAVTIIDADLVTKGAVIQNLAPSTLWVSVGATASKNTGFSLSGGLALSLPPTATGEAVSAIRENGESGGIYAYYS